MPVFFKSGVVFRYILYPFDFIPPFIVVHYVETPFRTDSLERVRQKQIIRDSAHIIRRNLPCHFRIFHCLLRVPHPAAPKLGDFPRRRHTPSIWRYVIIEFQKNILGISCIEKGKLKQSVITIYRGLRIFRPQKRGFVFRNQSGDFFFRGDTKPTEKKNKHRQEQKPFEPHRKTKPFFRIFFKQKSHIQHISTRKITLYINIKPPPRSSEVVDKQKNPQALNLRAFPNGRGGGTRTLDQRFRKPLLYPLSYAPFGFARDARA